MLVLLALVVVEVVPVDLLRERHSGEVTEQLIDRSGNTKCEMFYQLLQCGGQQFQNIIL